MPSLPSPSQRWAKSLFSSSGGSSRAASSASTFTSALFSPSLASPSLASPSLASPSAAASAAASSIGTSLITFSALSKKATNSSSSMVPSLLVSTTSKSSSIVSFLLRVRWYRSTLAAELLIFATSLDFRFTASSRACLQSISQRPMRASMRPSLLSGSFVSLFSTSLSSTFQAVSRSSVEAAIFAFAPATEALHASIASSTEMACFRISVAGVDLALAFMSCSIFSQAHTSLSASPTAEAPTLTLSMISAFFVSSCAARSAFSACRLPSRSRSRATPTAILITVKRPKATPLAPSSAWYLTMASAAAFDRSMENSPLA
mmetsp:Transcript_79999/g.226363  ORF Transcript_79999/g.226363 Transcript_79999/m.226363 type:complete len:319 (+) Transcript_79999:622-1578(+)